MESDPNYREGMSLEEYEERMREAYPKGYAKHHGVSAEEIALLDATDGRGFEFTPDQAAAIADVRGWFNSGNSPTYSIGGYAGTGKTTIVGQLRSELGIEIDAIAPTGKAAQRMTQKGIEAETIHSYIYNFEGKSRVENNRTGDVRQILHFGKKDGRQGQADLVVCDEASMVSQDLYDDLMTLVVDDGARILFVGDHGQLEPIGRNPGLMKNPNFRLETIMRQARDNPILAFAHRARSKASLRDNLDLVDNDRLRIVGRTPSDKLCRYAIDTGVDQIIVPFHRIRNRVNTMMRRMLHREGELDLGDKVVARLNNRKQHIYNGNQFEICTKPTLDRSYESSVGDRKFIASIKSLDDGRVWEDMSLFMPSPQGEWNDSCYKQSNIAIDYAYAITCHVAQGSEWDNVLVVYAPCRAWSDERWLYTAATRAANKLTVMAG